MAQNQISSSNSKPTSISHHDFEAQIISNPDGTYTRLVQFPSVPATPDPTTTSSSILSKDISVNRTNQTWLRIYLPRQALDSSSTIKLPVVVHYHGGGFVFVSASTSLIHDFSSEIAKTLTAIVISVEYRLAPEYRLPAAYEDAIDALHFIKNSTDDWLKSFADFSNCFLMGTSAGGNIAYHAGLRAVEEVKNLEPLKIKGLILHHPFFGGSERTRSELEMANGPVLSLSGCDFLWKLALPVGADRDHEYCNPTANGGSNKLELIRAMGWRVLVTGCYGDPLIDRQIELSKMLERKGVRIVAHFGEGQHGMEVTDLSKAKTLLSLMEDFISA